MSDTEIRRGRIFPVEVVGDLENTAKLILEKAQQELGEYHDTYLEEFEDWGYSNNYIVANGVIYRVEEVETEAYEDIFSATPNADGSFDFLLKYYNGGCGFSEAMEYALKGE